MFFPGFPESISCFLIQTIRRSSSHVLSLKSPENTAPCQTRAGLDGTGESGVGWAWPRGSWMRDCHLPGPRVQLRPAAGDLPGLACHWPLYPRPQGSLPLCQKLSRIGVVTVAVFFVVHTDRAHVHQHLCPLLSSLSLCVPDIIPFYGLERC